MSIAIVEYKIGGAAAAAASRTNTFTSPGQPASGNYWVGIGGVWYQDTVDTLAMNTPSGLTPAETINVGGQLSGLAKYKVSDGADGVNTIISKSGTARSFGLLSLNLSGVGALNASGQYTSGGSAVDGCTVSTSGNVTKDNCLAIAVFLRRGTLQGGSMSYTYTSGWTELGFAADWASPADECEIYVAYKYVNSGAVASCTFNPAGTNTNHIAFMLVFEPSLTAPGAPTGLSATAISGTQIDLSWTAPVSDGGSPITGYKIERETGIGNGWDLIVSDTGSTATTRSDEGLSQGQEYNYRVSAINAVGTGSPSTAASDTTDAATAPGTPTSLSAVADSPTSVALSWVAPVSDGGSPITGYKIERESPTGGGFSVLISDTGNTALSYRDESVVTATQYNYKVSAINAIGTSTASTASATTTPSVASNTQLGQIAFALQMPWLAPVAEGDPLDQADRQHLLAISRSPLANNIGGVLIAQQEQWVLAGI